VKCARRTGAESRFHCHFVLVNDSLSSCQKRRVSRILVNTTVFVVVLCAYYCASIETMEAFTVGSYRAPGGSDRIGLSASDGKPSADLDEVVR